MKRRKLPGKSDPYEVRETFETALLYQEDPEAFERALCTKINGGYICELADYFRAYDCRRETPFGPAKCVLEAEGSQFDKDSIYLAYLGVTPTREGYGSKFYGDLEKYLKNYRDIKRITLHSKWSAIPFWEKMGYEKLLEPERESDLYWWDFYTLPRYRKYLPTKGKRLKRKKYYPFKEFDKMIKEIPEFHPLQKRLFEY